MVNMGTRLEEGVCKGRLVKESDSSGSSKRYGNGFPQKKEHNVNTRTPPVLPKELPWWYKSDQHCAFHQGAPGHDIENYFALKVVVQRLIWGGILSFEDSSPNMQANSFPKHGGATVNMSEGCLGKYRVFDVNLIRRSLVEIHATLCEPSYYEQNHVSYRICLRNPRGCVMVNRGLQEMLDQYLIHITRDRDEDEHDVNVIVSHFNIPKPVMIACDSQRTVVYPLVIRLAGPTPYESDKVFPYKYSATMLEDGNEVPIHSLSSVVNIADVSDVTQSGQVFSFVSPRRIEDTLVGKKAQMETPIGQSGQSSGVNQNYDHDEALKLIKRSEFNMVNQLLHTPSKIFVLSLLMNSKVHREALYKVLEKAYMDCDVTVGQLDGTVANITAHNNMSFSNEELFKQGRNHNLDLHISMNCQDVMSNILVDTGSSLNGSGSPDEISLCLFQITFQVMDIHFAYSCLLGRPWIHEVGEVTSTLHKKLKFMKNGKLVIVGGEHAMLVSHLSSFSYIDADEVVGTLFQAFSIVDNIIKKNGSSMTSLKDAQQVMENGQSIG
ncbi:uncharacterized protein LOC127103462 [Lathyrus oleraceus]|uniref:uncharacterized protein LOC127103462 n=1 Tax=Pisum sativum TaxID=3888 RepID=UPI0021D103B8|nr:uncharacterized protein LOC127103462 [Pisum sativum]